VHAGQHLADGVAVQACGEHLLDAADAVDGREGVLALPAGGSFRSEQPFCLVIPQGPDADSGPFGQFTDAHDLLLDLTLMSGFTVQE